jgi:hypothetical protein
VSLRNLCLLRWAPLFAVLLIGCDENGVTEYWYSGTQLAVEACIKRNASMLVDAEVIKTKCISKHQQKVSPQIVGGRLTPEVSNLNGLSIPALLENKSSNEIITGIVITVTMAKEDSSNLVFTGILDGLWIQPNSSGHGYVRPPDSAAVWAQARDLMKAGAKRQRRSGSSSKYDPGLRLPRFRLEGLACS